LDRFLILESLVDGNWFWKSWVGSRGLLDHLLIIMKVEKEDLKPSSPLKFNNAWLLEEYFKKLIATTWTRAQLGKRTTSMKQFVDNIKRVKKIIKKLDNIPKRKIHGPSYRHLIKIKLLCENNVVGVFSKVER
jgi:hypothetical protein